MSMPPETIERDFPQTSNEALLTVLKTLDPTALHTTLINTIQEQGCTHNQRTLLTQVYHKILGIK